jgi:hypothetical protein
MSKGVGKHRHGESLERDRDAEKQFRKQAMQMARSALSKAIEWIDTGSGGDPSWALVNAKSAVRLLEVAKEI